MSDTGPPVLGQDSLGDRIAGVRASVAQAAEAARRSPSEITIVAVSKTVPRSSVDAAHAAGLRVFGESRVQEARAKYEIPLPSNASVHLIGQLQTNKARQAVALFACIESVDRISLIEALDRAAGKAELLVPVLVQVNVSRQSQQSGCAPDETGELVRIIQDSAHLRCNGLMTIAPLVTDVEDARPAFSGLRELRNALEQRFSVSLPVLSMGMSNDYEVAIAEGATHIRLGRAIFGSR